MHPHQRHCNTASCSIEDNEYVASLRYASMIQQSLMPDNIMLKSYLSDYFILNRPRDIVSGDFYYAYKRNTYTYLAVGDCTGHGVPGALLSILGISLLNEIVHTLHPPKANRILNHMREKMMKALHQTGDSNEAKDSIDIALCVHNNANHTLQFAGAYRPLVILQADGKATTIKPDKMPIGIAPLEEKAFTNHTIEIKPGNRYYLFSDGYYDQFGGKKDSKFKFRRFRELLSDIHTQPMPEQLEILEHTFNQWKGNNIQIDDVLVFGFQP
jgi:serine phosphatase RsbU (regulator of sigma subunit)